MLYKKSLNNILSNFDEIYDMWKKTGDEPPQFSSVEINERYVKYRIVK